MNDLDATLESVREIVERLAAERENGTDDAERMERLRVAAAALQEPPTVNGSADRPTGADWALYERNRAEIREIVKRLRNGSH